MIKEIPFAGMDTRALGSYSPEGSLALAYNLVNDDGTLKAYQPPVVEAEAIPGYTPLYIHETSAYRHIIYRKDDDGSLAWTQLSSGSTASLVSAGLRHTSPSEIEGSASTIPTGGACPDITAMGNTLIIAAPAGITYILWDPKAGAYSFLGNHIPEIDITFALKKASRMDSNFSVKSNIGMLSWDDGRHLTRIVEEFRKATEKNEFAQPFFVRYAYRFLDGSHSMASAPVLMIPNSSAPACKVHDETDSNIDYVMQPYYSTSLLYSILSDCTELKKWQKVITHIDFFVTPQVYTFDQSKTEIKISDTARSGDLRINYSRVAETENANPVYLTTTQHPAARIYDLHLPSRANLRLKPNGNPETSSQYSTSDKYLYYERFRSEMKELLLTASNFYKIAEIPIEEVMQMKKDNDQLYNTLYINKGVLSNLAQQSELIDDYKSHEHVVASAVYTYNARLTACDISTIPFKGFPLLSMAPANAAFASGQLDSVDVYVRINTSSGQKWVRNPDYGLASKYASVRTDMPRFFYYPDRNADAMLLVQEDWYLQIPLTEHPSLNGAYYLRGFSEDAPDWHTVGEDNYPMQIQQQVSTAPPIPDSSKIYLSDPGNPFSFPLLGRQTVGTGNVFALRAATRALSQGQFGQFPLYAFTSEGIWALSISDTGSIATVTPVTRDVPLSASGIAQTDTGILFPSARGIMLLEGAQAMPLTDPINEQTPLPLYTFRGASDIAPFVATPLAPFQTFLSTCTPLYDYAQQRIYLFSDKHPYAYLLSLRTNAWTIIPSSFAAPINSYPEALIRTAAGTLLNLSASANLFNRAEVETEEREAEEKQRVSIFTNPLPLDAPFALKTMRTAVARGIFAKNAAEIMLWGSRDLSTWHLIAKSHSEWIRHISGTPYRAFIIGISATLGPDDILTGATAEFIPKLSSRLR